MSTRYKFRDLEELATWLEGQATKCQDESHQRGGQMADKRALRAQADAYRSAARVVRATTLTGADADAARVVPGYAVAVETPLVVPPATLLAALGDVRNGYEARFTVEEVGGQRVLRRLEPEGPPPVRRPKRPRRAKDVKPEPDATAG